MTDAEWRARRARLLAACASGSPVPAHVQVRAVMRMLNQAARRSALGERDDFQGTSGGSETAATPPTIRKDAGASRSPSAKGDA